MIALPVQCMASRWLSSPADIIIKVTLIRLLQMVQAPSTANMAYIVDPRKEHTPGPATPAAQPHPPAKGGPQGAKAAASAGPPADLVGVFQQGVLQQWGKEWTGVAGSGQSCAGVALRELVGVCVRGFGKVLWRAYRSSQGLQISLAGQALSSRPQLQQVCFQILRLAMVCEPETLPVHVDTSLFPVQAMQSCSKC